MTSSRKESSRDGQRELHYSDIWLTKSIRYQSTKEIQRTVPSFCTGKRKERWSNIMNCLVLPILPSLHAHSVPILLTFIYFIHPLVCFGMPRIATSSPMHAFRAALPFHINPRTTPQFIGRSITGNGSFNERRLFVSIRTELLPVLM